MKGMGDAGLNDDDSLSIVEFIAVKSLKIELPIQTQADGCSREQTRMADQLMRVPLDGGGGVF